MMAPTMARHSTHKPDRATPHRRMQQIDDPTASFPIGLLSQLVERPPPGLPEQSGSHRHARNDTEEETDPSALHASSRSIQVGYLLLSLLGGGVAAAMFAALVVVVVLLL